MEIKLMVNGKEIQLTEEQIKSLGLRVKDDPFDIKKMKNIGQYSPMVN